MLDKLLGPISHIDLVNKILALSLCFRGPGSGPPPTGNLGIPCQNHPSQLPGPLSQVQCQCARPKAEDGQGAAVLKGMGSQSLDMWPELWERGEQEEDRAGHTLGFLFQNPSLKTSISVAPRDSQTLTTITFRSPGKMPLLPWLDLRLLILHSLRSGFSPVPSQEVNHIHFVGFYKSSHAF